MANERSKDGGREKARAHEEPPSSSNAAGANGNVRGAGQTLATALRSSMASNQLGSLLNSAAGGNKEEFRQAASGSSNQTLREWLTDDLMSQASSSSSSSSSRTTANVPSFRSHPAVQTQSRAEFDDFSSGMQQTSHGMEARHTAPVAESSAARSEMDSIWPLAQRRNHVNWTDYGLDPRQNGAPISSYTELDAPLHDVVRAGTSASRSTQPHLAAARTQPGQPDTADIFALLDAEESSSSAPTEPVEVSSSTIPGLATGVLQQFDARYRPPSPSNSGFSAEQAAMHLALAESQAAEQGKQELAVPRPDNPEQQEGVYALTAEDALRSIFDGRTESSTQTSTEQSADPATVVVNKITRYFATSTYLDDVYGLPPLLRETIEQAIRTDQADSEHSRQIAIRRLESLWNHISNTAPAPQTQPEPTQNAQSSQWVDAWLRTNT